MYHHACSGVEDPHLLSNSFYGPDIRVRTFEDVFELGQLSVSLDNASLTFWYISLADFLLGAAFVSASRSSTSIAVLARTETSDSPASEMYSLDIRLVANGAFLAVFLAGA